MKRTRRIKRSGQQDLDIADLILDSEDTVFHQHHYTQMDNKTPFYTTLYNYYLQTMFLDNYVQKEKIKIPKYGPGMRKYQNG